MLAVDFLQQFHELLDGVGLQLALAQVGLVDEELDLCLLLLCGDALEGVGGEACTAVEHGLLVELGGGDDAVGHFHSGNLDLALAYACIEGHEQFALEHLGHILELRLDGVDAAKLVVDALVVAQHLLAHEGCALGACHLPVAIVELGDDADDGLLLQVLGGELAMNGGYHLAALSLKRTWVDIEIAGCQFAHSGRTGG